MKQHCIFNIKILTSVFFTLMFFAVSVSAQVLTFSGKQIASNGQYQTTADFNGDGRADIATAGLDVGVLLGNGNGTFQALAVYPVGVSLTGITSGDFNNDAKLDLAVSLNDTIEVGVLLGNGDGTFRAVSRFSTGGASGVTSVIAADFNRDGKLDLMTSNPANCLNCGVTDSVSFLRGNGDGTFLTPQLIQIGAYSQKLEPGDFNRDGIADVVAAAWGKAFILLGNGDGSFRQTEIPIITNVNNTDVVVSDFNGDTIQDLAIAADGESKIGILLGNGDGTFGAVSLIVDTLQQRPWTLSVGDFNRDGRQDILTGIGDCCAGAGTTGGAFAVLPGNGNGTFQPFQRFINGNSGAGTIQLATIDPVIADFNGDGKPDMASYFYNAVGGNPGGMLIALNTSGVPPANNAFGTMTVAPSSIVGGTRAVVDIPLVAGAVASSNIALTLSNTNPSVAFFPFSTTSPPFVIVKGMTNVRFFVETNSVTTTQTVTITVSAKGFGSRSVILTVTPPNTPLAVGSIQMQPSGVFGANDSTGVVTLATGYVAPIGGALVTLTNGNPNLVSMPSSVTIPAGQTNASFPIQTNSTGITTPVNISASYGGVTKTAVLTVTAPTQNIPLSSVTIAPSTIVGGSNIAVRVTVNLAAGAPGEGATIQLSSSNPAIVSVPRTIQIFFAGETSRSTDVVAAPVGAPTQVTITATYGGSTQSAILTVTPPANNAPTITALTVNPASVTGGTAAQGTVTLSAAATTATSVTLSSSSAPIVTVPASVTVPAGATTANFTINTTTISSSFSATITASLNGLSRSTPLTVTPAGDTVSISRAEYTASNRTLRVEATGTRTTATLQVFVTSSGQLIGTLTNNSSGRYSGNLNWSVNPQNITVRSNFGGSATRAVTLK